MRPGSTLAAVGALGMGALGWALREAQALVIETIRVPLASESALGGMTVLHLSDLHAKGPQTWSIGALRQLEGLDPDLVLVTGDMITQPPGLRPAARALARLQSRLGTFVTLGNHDHYHGTLGQRLTGAIGRFSHPEAVLRVFAEEGLNTLRNSSCRLETVSDALQLVGTDDPYFGIADLDLAYAKVDPTEPVLLLAHSPDAARLVGGRRCDLMLSGHTHGGQILAPGGIIRGMTNTALRLPATYGLMMLEGVPTHVSAGVGTANLPLRFNCPPRATLLEFVNPTKALEASA
ncbi:MAG TPA: metallophosphoesterase [Chloroflexota bacterium]|nr:metallophosphoesterase [Chloroflexota bacterium]